MKSILTKLTTAALSLATLLITGSAWAATPTAVWDGDFNTATKSGWTLSLKSGGALPTAVSPLALSGDVLKLDSANTKYANGAIVVRYSGYTASSLANTAIASAYVNGGSEDAGCEANNGILKTYWGTTVNRSLTTTLGSYSKDNVSIPASGYMILAYNTGAGTAAYFTDKDKGEWKGGYDNEIKWKDKTVVGFAVGGPRQATPNAAMGPCSTMTIEAVAVFENYNGLDQSGIEGLMAYKFPRETANDALIALWNEDLDETTKGDYVLNLNGNVPSGGVVTLTAGMSITKTGGNFDKVNTVIMEVENMPTDATSTSIKTILSYKAGGGNLTLDSVADSKFKIDWGRNHASAKTSTTTIPSGKHIVAYAYNGGSKIGETAYVDGLPVVTAALYTSNDAVTPIYIGSYTDGSCIATGMKVSKIAIFNKQLSAAEVAAYEFPVIPFVEPDGTEDENGIAPNFWYQFNGNTTKASCADDIPDMSTVGSTYGNDRAEQADKAILISSGLQKNISNEPKTQLSDPDHTVEKTTAFTVSCIAKLAAPASGKAVLWCFGPTSPYIALAADVANGNIEVLYSGTAKYQISVPDMTTAFHTYVVVGRGNSTVDFYIDGVKQSGTGTGWYPETHRTAFGFANIAQNVSGLSAAIGSYIDDFRVYRGTALSDDEVAKIGKNTYSPGPTKATVTIDTNTTQLINWGDIQWDSDVEPSATLPAEITLTGSNLLTIRQNSETDAITAKGITFKGTSSAKLMLSPLLTYNGGKITSGIPFELQTEVSVDVDAGANDLTYSYTGAEISPNLTYTGNFTKAGSGTISLNHNVPSGKTLTVAGGTLKLAAGDQGIVGTLIIEKGATFVNLTGDGANYGGNPKIYVYGTLDMGNTRWTTSVNTFNFYPGSSLIGNGDGNAAIDVYGNQTYKFLKDSEGNGGTVTISGKFRFRSVFNVEVEDGMTAYFCCPFAQNGGLRTVNKSGAGVLKLSTDLSQGSNAFNINAGTLEVATGAVVPTTTIAAGATLKATGACASNFTVNGALVFDGGSLTGTISGTPTSVTVQGETEAIGYLAVATFDLAENATLVMTSATDPLISGTINSVGDGSKVKLPQGFAFGTIANVGEGVTSVTVVNAAGETVATAKVENGQLIVPKSEITTEYAVEGTKVVAEDIAFGEDGSIVFKTDTSTLNVTGTVTLPTGDVKLPISFALKGEYAKDETFTLITASNGIVKNGSPATLEGFDLPTVSMLSGMTGEFQLITDNDVVTGLKFVITSETITKAAADVLNAGHLIRRFDANRGITKDENGSISQWNDISGNSDNAVSYGNHALPTYVTGDARNYVDFGVTGSNKDLGWTQVTTLRTAIVVVDIEENWCAFLLGDSSKGTFHRGYNTNDGNVVASYGDSREVKYSGVRDNGQVVEWKTTVIPTGFRVISVTTTENQSVSQFTQDRSQGTGRTGGKKLSEVLIFDSVLTDEQLAAVEAYLTTKWRIGFKNTVKLPAGETKWSAIDWDADQFYADASTEITLGGNTTLVYDMATAPIGNITFVKGDYTLEQVIDAEVTFASDITIPAGETYIIRGGTTEEETSSFANNITVNGTLMTDGYVDFSTCLITGSSNVKMISSGVTTIGANVIHSSGQDSQPLSAIEVIGGTLKLGNTATFYHGGNSRNGTPLVVKGGTLDLNGAYTWNASDGSGILTQKGVTLGGPEIATITGGNFTFYSGNITDCIIYDGGNGANAQAEFAANWHGSYQDATLNRNINVGDGAGLDYDLLISGTLGLPGAQFAGTTIHKTGVGTVMMTGAFNMPALSIDVGTWKIGAANAVSANTTVGATGTLDVNGLTVDIPTLTSAGSIINSSETAATINITSTATISGNISNVTIVSQGGEISVEEGASIADGVKFIVDLDNASIGTTPFTFADDSFYSQVETKGGNGSLTYDPSTHQISFANKWLSDTMIWLPIGDSITEGEQYMGGLPDQGDVNTRGGYRYQIYKQLTEAGKDVRSVGYRTGHQGTIEPDDCPWAWHAAQYGGVIAHDNDGTHGCALFDVENTLQVAGYPDVITILLGVNDLSFGNPAATDVYDSMDAMVKKIAKMRPNTKILISTLLPAGGGRSYINTYNTLLREKSTQGTSPFNLSNVKLIDVNAQFGQYADGYFKTDHLHPNETGSIKVANLFSGFMATAVGEIVDADAKMVHIHNGENGYVVVRFSKALADGATATLTINGVDVDGEMVNQTFENGAIDATDKRVMRFAIPENMTLKGGVYTATLSAIDTTTLASDFVEIQGTGAAANIDKAYRNGFQRYETISFSDGTITDGIGSGDNWAGNGPAATQVEMGDVVGHYIKRIGYYVELKRQGEPSQFVWVSMNAFDANVLNSGIPTVASGAHKAKVMNLQVYANRANVTNTAIDNGVVDTTQTGVVEFTPWSWTGNEQSDYPNDIYSGKNGWNDTLETAAGTLKGGMQVFRYTGSESVNTFTKFAAETVFAVNNFNCNTAMDLGIGSFSTHRNNAGGGATPTWDWSDFVSSSKFTKFAVNTYEVKKIEIWVELDPDKVFPAEVGENESWSTLTWKDAAGETVQTLPEGAEVILKVADVAASLTIDANVTQPILSVIDSSADKSIAISSSDGFTASFNTINIADCLGEVALNFDVGATPIVAGVNTILAVPGTGNITIGSGKQLTVKSGSVYETKTSIDKSATPGVLNFDGGTADAPIVYEANGANNASPGKMTIAQNAYLKFRANNNKVYNIEGAGANASTCEICKTSGGLGMSDGCKFRNLTLIPTGFSGGDYFWVERADSLDATVNLDAGSQIKLNGYSPVIGSLMGSGDIIIHSGTASITITPTIDATYSGASSVPFTIAASEYTQTLSGNYTGALTVNAGGKVNLAGNANPSSMAVNGDMTIDVASGTTKTISGAITGSGNITKTGAGTLKLTGSRTNFTGTLTISEGAFDIGNIRDFSTMGSVAFSGTGTLIATATSAEYGEGAASFTNLPASLTELKFIVNGVEQTLTVLEGNATYSGPVVIDGAATWLDYTFTKDTREARKESQAYILNAGSAGVNVSLQYDTNYNANNSYNEENGSLLAKSTPWRKMDGTSAWPSSYTAAVYANVPDVENGCLVGFGSSSEGKSYVVIVRGEDSNTIKLMKGTDVNTKATPIVEMSALNVTSSKHLIVFTNQGGKFTVYCDGVKAAEIDAISLGRGFQIGSVHGGVAPSASYKGKDYTGITRVSEIEDQTIKDAIEVGAIRVWDRLITSAEMDALVAEFPYINKAGLFDRTIDAATANLSEENAWANHETQEKVALPQSKTEDEVTYQPSISVETTVESTLTLNDSLTVDTATFDGDGTLTITAGGSENALTVGGSITVNSPIKIKYGEVNISTVPLKLGASGAVEIDLADCGFSPTVVGRHQLTGVTDEAAGKITIKNQPTAQYFKGELVHEDGSYWFKVSADRTASILYLTESATLSDNTLFAMTDGGQAIMPRVFADDVIYVKTGLTATMPSTALTIKPKFDGVGTIAVNGGTLKNSAPLFTLASTWTGTVEMTNIAMAGDSANESWFSLNAYGNENSKVKLAGATGYMQHAVEFLPEVMLENTSTKAGIEITGGASSSTLQFRKVSGTGNLLNNPGANVSQRMAIGDASGHTGQVRALGAGGITLGSEENTAGNGQIVVANGTTIAFNGQMWEAANGVSFGQTLDIIGAAGNYITMPEPATLPEITVGGQPTSLMLKYEEGKLMLAQAAAKIGTVFYLTLNDAIEAAQDGDTITVLSTLENATATVPADKNIIIANNGGLAAFSGTFTKAGLGTLTTKCWYDSSANVVVNEGTLVISDAGGLTDYGRPTEVKTGATFEFNTVMDLGEDPFVVHCAITGGGIVRKTGDMALALYSESNTFVGFSGLIDVSVGALMSLETLTVKNTIAIADGATVMTAGLATGDGARIKVEGATALQAYGNLVKQGALYLDLSAFETIENGLRLVSWTDAKLEDVTVEWPVADAASLKVVEEDSALWLAVSVTEKKDVIEIEPGTKVVVEDAFVQDLPGEGTVAEKLTAKPEGAKFSYIEGYALGLTVSQVAQVKKPYLKAAPAQTTLGKTTFNFFFGNETEAIQPRQGVGKTVKYSVLMASSRDAESWTTEGETTSNSVTVDLPQPSAGNSAVRYYKPLFTFE